MRTNSPMWNTIFQLHRNVFLAALMTGLAFLPCVVSAGDTAETRWKDDLQRFRREAETSPPPANAVLFVGSSTIFHWDVKQSFPDLVCINRGFGGSQMSDVVELADQIVVPARPRLVVLYSGDNDLNAGKSPEKVAADFKAVVKQLREALPQTRIIALAVKPSESRIRLLPEIREANRRMAQIALDQENVEFVDLGHLLLDEQGRPDPACYQSDKLHLSELGYRRWSEALRERLTSDE